MVNSLTCCATHVPRAPITDIRVDTKRDSRVFKIRMRRVAAISVEVTQRFRLQSPGQVEVAAGSFSLRFGRKAFPKARLSRCF